MNNKKGKSIQDASKNITILQSKAYSLDVPQDKHKQ